MMLVYCKSLHSFLYRDLWKWLDIIDIMNPLMLPIHWKPEGCKQRFRLDIRLFNTHKLIDEDWTQDRFHENVYPVDHWTGIQWCFCITSITIRYCVTTIHCFRWVTTIPHSTHLNSTDYGFPLKFQEVLCSMNRFWQEPYSL